MLRLAEGEIPSERAGVAPEVAMSVVGLIFAEDFGPVFGEVSQT